MLKSCSIFCYLLFLSLFDRKMFFYRRKKLSCIVILFIFLLQIYLIKKRPEDRFSVKQYPKNDNITKYMRFECVKSDLSGCGGWADRLKGIISTYTWALLTQRKFSIKFTHPCKLNNILNSNEIAWDFSTNYLDDDDTVTKQDIFMHYDQEFVKELEHIDVLEYSNAQLIKIRSGLMFVDSFSKNPKLHKRIKELGYEPRDFKFFKLFHQFYNKLFKLAPEMQKQYDLFLKNARSSTNTRIICAQLRFGSSNDFVFMNRKDSFQYWKFINETFLYGKEFNLASGSFKIYVTSDHEDVKYEAERVFGKDKVIFYKDSSMHIENDFKHEDTSAECKNFKNVLLDFHTLQNCDMSVLSHSGFGILGNWNRKDPNKNVYVFTNQELIKSNYWNRKDLNFIRINDFENFYFL